MKLYVTATSPYARIARAMVLEKGFADSVEIINAITRKVDSPYYAINPSGRVPYLVRDDGVGIEDSRLIAAYLDSLDGNPSIVAPFDIANWESGRLEIYARSMVDGISVWVREMRRPENERSPTLQAHEASRAGRLADFWENEITAPLMNGPLNLSQLLLISGLDFAAYGRMGDFTEGRPQLAKWAAQMRQRPSLAVTAPIRGN
jgi:glutathione S-transferase